ncbi:hypothetical protein Q8A67_019430 [Cirrhinus molitorella]|uniref:Uncharacterized protein n=1 Tax=Cirrhinus molitorella TaxID=172907 RepID=A0AA88P764_9TELE|nr:hypothetical protein Q8A67_019430 [Cirrhinus molitorella]
MAESNSSRAMRQASSPMSSREQGMEMVEEREWLQEQDVDFAGQCGTHEDVKESSIRTRRDFLCAHRTRFDQDVLIQYVSI